MAKEHSGGRPDTVWQRLEVGAWSEEKFPVPITRFPMEKVFADLDGPEGDSQAAIQAKAALEALRVFLRWVRGEGRLGGQRTRLHVLYRVFLPEEYEGKTDLEMARLAGLRSKQAFSKEKLAFARAYGFRERNMRSPAACLSMKRSYALRHANGNERDPANALIPAKSPPDASKGREPSQLEQIRAMIDALDPKTRRRIHALAGAIRFAVMRNDRRGGGLALALVAAELDSQ